MTKDERLAIVHPGHSGEIEMQNGRNHFIQNLDYEDAKRIYRERGVELSTLEELLELAS